MVCNNDEVVASLRKIANLLETSGHSECLPLDCGVMEPGACKGDPPSPGNSPGLVMGSHSVVRERSSRCCVRISRGGGRFVAACQIFQLHGVWLRRWLL